MKSKKKRKPIAIILCAVGLLTAAVALVTLVLNLYVVLSQNPDIYAAEDITGDYECIMVLGCGVTRGKPSPLLQARLDKGLELYRLGTAPKILVTGDNGHITYDEVSVMRDFLIGEGVPTEDIVCDYAGFSTYESVYRARDVFTVRKMIIVTQPYHLSRALYIADNLGVEAVGCGAFTPQGGQTYRDLREILARNKDVLFCIFKPLPTYLGDPIPIGGSTLDAA